MANQQHIEWLLEGVEAWNARREREDFKPDFVGADISGEFGKREKLGADGRVCLRGINLRKANLTDAKLTQANLTNADLTDANLTGANLNLTDLTCANLNLTDLTRAYLSQANLTRAHSTTAKLTQTNLISADLTGAMLIKSDLTGAKLDSANLTDAALNESNLSQASLITANLTNADLTDANLINVNLLFSKLWEARLYEHQNTSHGNDNNEIKSIEDLLKACRDLKNKYPDYVLYFRGERCDSWVLQPSVMRCSKLYEKESEMLNELMSRQPDEFSGLTSAFSQWVIAQHYGLKTRLLDVTRNPLVALFNVCEKCDANCEDGRLHVFAVPGDMIKPFNSDTVSIIANFAKLSRPEQNLLLGKKLSCPEQNLLLGKRTQSMLSTTLHPLHLHDQYSRYKRRLYHFIRHEKPHFEERIEPRELFRVFVVEPQQSFERVRVQSGAFLISAFHERFESKKILKWNPDIPVYEHYPLTVPKNKKKAMMKDLSLLNITRESLFPGLDSATEAITDHYRSG